LGNDTIPTVEIELGEAEEMELNVRLNKNTGEFDFDILANYFDMDILKEWGFEDYEFGMAYDEEPEAGLIDDDEIPEAKESKVKRGDIWQLGEHRVMCGDSTSSDDVEKLMNGEKADLITDPPYGINANKQTLGTGKKQFYRGNDWDKEVPDFWNMIPLFDKCIIWGGNYFADKLSVTNDWLCWHKKNDNLSFSEFELAWSNVGKNCRILSHHWGGEKKLHPTMKPVKVMEWCIGMIDSNNIIFDLFLGSGSTLIAAEKLNRKCYGMELDEKYCDVIIERWEQFTGNEAHRINENK
jgi:DNA modification methylase